MDRPSRQIQIKMSRFSLLPRPKSRGNLSETIEIRFSPAEVSRMQEIAAEEGAASVKELIRRLADKIMQEAESSPAED